MKTKIYLFSLLFLCISCKKQNEEITPLPDHYRAYIMSQDYLFINQSNGFQIPDIKGTIVFTKDNIELRITQYNDIILSKSYKITQEYSKTFDSYFLYSDSQVIGIFNPKGMSGSTKDEIRLNIKDLQTTSYYKATLSSSFF